MTEHAAAYSVERVMEALRADPGLREVLADVVLLQAAGVAGQGDWLGFTRTEARATPQQIQRLLTNRVIRVLYESRSRSSYALEDERAVREALERELAPPAEETPEPLPDDLFAVVVGLERELALVRAALEADRPVHVLLVGPPAAAKSLILSELERLRGARRVLGATTTRAGVVDYLLVVPGCRYLLVDELEELSGRDLSSVMHSLMEEGRVERLQHGRTEQEHRDVWVVATCNGAQRLGAALRSRFTVKVHLPAYTEAEFRQVVLQVLVAREGADPELAAEIAEAVAPRTRNVRDAVGICRMCGGDRRRVAGFVEEVFR